MILIHNRLFIIILILILIPPCKSSIIRDPCDNCPDAGIELFKQKKFKEAQASFMKCIACLNNQYPANDSLFYYLYNYVGAACYYLNDFDKATEYYKKTLVYLENFRKESIADKANILNNIADAYMFKGEYDSSEAYYKKNLLLKRKQADTLNYDFARSYINMSALYYRCGKINKALYYSVLAENIINKTEPPDKVKLASLYLNRGNIYFVDKQYDPALIYYNNALNYFTEADSALYQEQLYKVLLNTGSIYFSKKSYAQAINFYKRAINIYQSPNQLERTYICKYLARAYEKTGENLLAERYYKLSVALCPENRPFERIKNMIYYFKFCSVAGEKEYSKALSEQALKLSLDAFGEHHPLTAECYYVIAKCCLINEDFNTASKYFQLALISVSDTSFGSEEICSNPLAENVLSDILFIKILEGKSTALYKAAAGRGDYLQCSYNTIKLLLDVIAHVRNRYLTNESKYYLSENEYDYYNFAIETAYEMYKTTGDSLYLKEAFVYADRSKYITLTESLFNLENKKICRIPDTLIKIENLILKNIGFYRSKLQQENSSGNPDRAKLNLWNDKLFTFNKKLFTLTNYFEKRYPEYYKLKYDTNYIGSVEALQEYLATDNCMVEYSIIDSVIYIFLVTADNFYVHKDTLTGEFFNSLMSIGNSIVSYNPDEHTVQQYDSMVRG
ncbi:MAG: tetratricopeptide repeat protein [Bacteroidia bacterium]|nr:tetratricopeptide repeat protein [Bacteroidia bacterium]